MSQLPPGDYPNTPAYQSPGLGRNGLAVGALICGIVGILLSIILIGVALGIVAIVLGAVALSQIARAPGTSGRGMAVTGLILGIVSLLMGPVLLFAAILMPSLGRPRELSNRSACAANLRDISQSMIVYAAGNNEIYPIVPYAPLGAANGGTSAQLTGDTDASAAQKFVFGPASTQNGSVLAAQWLLVLNEQVAPKGYLCKSDPSATTPASTDSAGNFYANFQADNQISYSFAYPYALTPDGPKVGEWWKDTSDASLVIASDMAPLDGTGKPPRTVGRPIAGGGGALRAWNSGNHLGDGQNVAFADSHVEFVRRPDIGADNDNLFTTGAGGPMASGMQPAKGPITLPARAPFDIVVVPVRNLDTGRLW